LQGFTWISEM